MLRINLIKPGADQEDIYQPWMLDAISGSGIRSLRREDLCKYEDINTGKRIKLQDLVLLMYGTLSNGGKAMWFINLMACERCMLEGPHFVRVIGHESVWVKSLHTWRRQAFGISDLLSFERSVFAIIPSCQKLVRIKTIRSWCELPSTNPPIWRQHSYVSKRTENQLASYMDRLITSYMRDGQTDDVERVVEHIKCHVVTYLCNRLRHYHGITDYSDFLEDMLLWRSVQMDMGLTRKNCSSWDHPTPAVLQLQPGVSTESFTSNETEEEQEHGGDCKRQKLVPLPHEAA